MPYLTSFAFDGVGGHWEWYEENGQNLPMAEIRQIAAIVAADQGRLAEIDFRALIRRKLRRAEAGRLHEPEDGRSNIVKADGIRELAWRQGRNQWRLYYCEPLQLHVDRVMLALHFARKVDKEQQNQDISEAARRWTCWQARQQS